MLWTVYKIYVNIKVYIQKYINIRNVDVERCFNIRNYSKRALIFDIVERWMVYE